MTKTEKKEFLKAVFQGKVTKENISSYGEADLTKLTVEELNRLARVQEKYQHRIKITDEDAEFLKQIEEALIIRPTGYGETESYKVD